MVFITQKDITQNRFSSTQNCDVYLMIISMNSGCVAQHFYKLGLIPILDSKLARGRCLAVVAVALNVI